MLDLSSKSSEFRSVQFASVVVSLILAAFVLPGLSTETRNLNFAVFPAKTTTVKLTSTAGIGDDTITTYPNQTTATYGGAIGASISFAPDTLVISSFAYTGGYVQRAELDPILQIFPSIPYTGISTPLPTSLLRSSSSSATPFYRGFTPFTLNPPASVNPVTGVIGGSHQWITDFCRERITSSRPLPSFIINQEIVAPPPPRSDTPPPWHTKHHTGTNRRIHFPPEHSGHPHLSVQRIRRSYTPRVCCTGHRAGNRQLEHYGFIHLADRL